jgi:glucose-6-phosphate 1-dehydrogenase
MASLDVIATRSGLPAGAMATLDARAHASLLTSAVRGDVTRFLRADEVEAAWEWIEPIAHRWDSSPGRPSPYRASRVGPLDAAHLLGREGRAWHDVAC